MATIIRSPSVQDAKPIPQIDVPNIEVPTTREEVLKDTQQTSIESEQKGPTLSERIEQAVAEQTKVLNDKNQQLTEQLERLQAQYDELNSTIKQAIDEGREQGAKEGREQAKQSASESQAAWEAAVDQLKQHTVESIYDQQTQCVELAYAAVCRIIGCASTQKDYVESMVQELIDQHIGTDKVTVKVSKHDYQQLQEHSDYLLEHVSISDDIKHGGCILSTGVGKLDARLDLQLQGIKDTLLKVHRQRSLSED